MDGLHYMLLAYIVTLQIVFALREKAHDRERNDLYSRFMAVEQIEYMPVGGKKVNLKGRNLIQKNIEKHLSATSRPPDEQ